ncbi:Lrp/AsnC family transcriptional regulator [Candidatus Raskinella chloraquaticus]|uniref:ArsR family transcriptional regulator n=1 Tax=Candidatus Raskinella chloraquaticus TaxID=1951219 RepID=A0A1W9I4S3_9HYPH|nr:MAG: ArsR family transcriptional regulator [Proteobacteria bacterium SG_bin8]
MKRIKLDQIDCRILSELQTDGRMTNVELANRAGISAPPCLRRVRALEDAGYIKGYHAVLAADKLGYGLMVFAQVSLETHGEADLIKFREHVAILPEVREIYALTGDFDFLIKIVAKDWDSYQRFLMQNLTSYKGIRHVKSSPCVGVYKNAPGVPVPEQMGHEDPFRD